MTTIKVTPDQLLSVSKQFAAAQSQIAQMNHILKQQLFEIERQWSGSTKERFYADFVAAQRVMENFISLSLSIAKTLEGHAEKFRLADQQAVQTYDANCMPPPPNACQAQVTDTRNFFQKSADSLAELGTAFMQAADDRYQKRYDSVGGFLDYWTFGIPSGLVEGYMDRANKAFDSPNDTANWLTFGIHGTIREAIFPTNAWSSEHWANMIGMGGMMVGGGITAKMIKPHNLLTSSGGGTKIGGFNSSTGAGDKPSISLNKNADPFYNIYGSGSKSHPEEWNKIIKDIESLGGNIKFREDGSMGYSPGLSRGQAGEIIIDNNASLSALRHEYQHFLDDMKIGWGGMSTLYDFKTRVIWELRAYMKEIREAEKLGYKDVAEQLWENYRAERKKILDDFGPLP
nr:WXG100 family type VII secretion target [Paenibacillus xylanexedens]